MKLRELCKKLESVSYCCADCGHEENISELTCAHCHKQGTVTFDKSKNYPVICVSCRDKGLYVKCSQCHASIYFMTFKKNSLPLSAFVISSLLLIVFLIGWHQFD